MPNCPEGHDSASTDFCVVCGLAMGGSAPAAVSTVVTAAVDPDEVCPECGEPRTGRFCEGCSYDFVAGTSRAPVAAPAVSAPLSVPVAVATWAAVVSADRAHFDAVQQQDGPDVIPDIAEADQQARRHCQQQRVAGQAGQHASLVGDLGREDDVEGRDAVRCDEQQPLVVECVELADLAATDVHCFRH